MKIYAKNNIIPYEYAYCQKKKIKKKESIDNDEKSDQKNNNNVNDI